MDDVVRYTVAGLAGCAAVVCTGIVYLWGKHDRYSIRIREWLLEAAANQFARPCLVFRLSIGLMAGAFVMICYRNVFALESVEEARLMALTGFVGTIYAAIFHRYRLSVRLSKAAVGQADCVRSIGESGFGRVEPVHLTVAEPDAGRRGLGVGGEREAVERGLAGCEDAGRDPDTVVILSYAK